MHYMTTTPFQLYFTFSATASVREALDFSLASLPHPHPPKPTERLQVVQFGVEFGFMWLSFLRQLASRPQGPPDCVRITIIDACAQARMMNCVTLQNDKTDKNTRGIAT